MTPRVRFRRPLSVRRGRTIVSTAALFFALAIDAPAARAQVSFNVTFYDPAGAHTAYYDQIRTHALVAGETWARHLVSTVPSSLGVFIGFPSDVPRATGRSLIGSYVATNGGIHTYEQGAAAEIRTGVDPNGVAPDIEINLGPEYLTQELWFDPNPSARTAPVAANRVDALSVLLHEFGHALSFNGWRDGATGLFPGNYQSTFDRQTSVEGGIPFFRGSNAMRVHGGPVAITSGNANHIGNSARLPCSDLIPDLMNGVVFFRGQRYGISNLGLAITEDSGLRTAAFGPIAAAVLEAGTTALPGGPCLIVAGRVTRRTRQAHAR
jgi:hypothetical protein